MRGKERMDSRGTIQEEPTGSGKPLDRGRRGGADSQALGVTAGIRAPLPGENIWGEKNKAHRGVCSLR